MRPVDSFKNLVKNVILVSPIHKLLFFPIRGLYNKRDYSEPVLCGAWKFGFGRL